MSLRTSLCPFPQKEQDRLPWWWLSFLLMSPPLHASVRGQRKRRQPQRWVQVLPLTESIDVPPVTPETRRRNMAIDATRPAKRPDGHAQGRAAHRAAVAVRRTASRRRRRWKATSG